MFFVTNLSEKYARQNWMISPGKGENKKCLSCHRLVLIRAKDGTKEKSIRKSVTFREKNQRTFTNKQFGKPQAFVAILCSKHLSNSSEQKKTDIIICSISS